MRTNIEIDDGLMREGERTVGTLKGLNVRKIERGGAERRRKTVGRLADWAGWPISCSSLLA
jgi:hypothetical protein